MERLWEFGIKSSVHLKLAKFLKAVETEVLNFRRKRREKWKLKRIYL